MIECAADLFYIRQGAERRLTRQICDRNNQPVASPLMGPRPRRPFLNMMTWWLTIFGSRSSRANYAVTNPKLCIEASRKIDWGGNFFALHFDISKKNINFAANNQYDD